MEDGIWDTRMSNVRWSSVSLSACASRGSWAVYSGRLETWSEHSRTSNYVVSQRPCLLLFLGEFLIFLIARFRFSQLIVVALYSTTKKIWGNARKKLELPESTEHDTVAHFESLFGRWRLVNTVPIIVCSAVRTP